MTTTTIPSTDQTDTLPKLTGSRITVNVRDRLEPGDVAFLLATDRGLFAFSVPPLLDLTPVARGQQGDVSLTHYTPGHSGRAAGRAVLMARLKTGVCTLSPITGTSPEMITEIPHL